MMLALERTMAKAHSKTTRRGSVRIIGGDWRRRQIPLPPVAGLRPTPDRVRETVFNWLMPMLPGASCLDLFAGSGALGLEALSRGARHAVFVEADPICADAIAERCRALDADAEIVRADVADYLSRPPRGRFDVVFVDPPYSASVEPVLDALAALSPQPGIVYVERARSDPWPGNSGLDWFKRATAGGVAFGLGRFAAAE
ncbi:MAG: 16S rRNA (guanine(966)-N(2))-methyltransferase RsmD [Gammaproteobacteria bacterium]|nr:16S rRNA (guanine(966)-N(2))-methyltransferase RsmD [Gammaproteobacteria bacterium]